MKKSLLALAIISLTACGSSDDSSPETVPPVDRLPPVDTTPPCTVDCDGESIPTTPDSPIYLPIVPPVDTTPPCTEDCGGEEVDPTDPDTPITPPATQPPVDKEPPVDALPPCTEDCGEVEPTEPTDPDTPIGGGRPPVIDPTDPCTDDCGGSPVEPTDPDAPIDEGDKPSSGWHIAAAYNKPLGACGSVDTTDYSKSSNLYLFRPDWSGYSRASVIRVVDTPTGGENATVVDNASFFAEVAGEYTFEVLLMQGDEVVIDELMTVEVLESANNLAKDTDHVVGGVVGNTCSIEVDHDVTFEGLHVITYIHKDLIGQFPSSSFHVGGSLTKDVTVVLDGVTFDTDGHAAMSSYGRSGDTVHFKNMWLDSLFTAHDSAHLMLENVEINNIHTASTHPSVYDKVTVVNSKLSGELTNVISPLAAKDNVTILNSELNNLSVEGHGAEVAMRQADFNGRFAEVRLHDTTQQAELTNNYWSEGSAKMVFDEGAGYNADGEVFEPIHDDGVVEYPGWHLAIAHRWNIPVQLITDNCNAVNNAASRGATLTCTWSHEEESFRMITVNKAGESGWEMQFNTVISPESVTFERDPNFINLINRDITEADGVTFNDDRILVAINNTNGDSTGTGVMSETGYTVSQNETRTVLLAYFYESVMNINPNSRNNMVTADRVDVEPVGSYIDADGVSHYITLDDSDITEAVNVMDEIASYVFGN